MTYCGQGTAPADTETRRRGDSEKKSSSKRAQNLGSQEMLERTSKINYITSRRVSHSPCRRVGAQEALSRSPLEWSVLKILPRDPE